MMAFGTTRTNTGMHFYTQRMYSGSFDRYAYIHVCVIRKATYLHMPTHTTMYDRLWILCMVVYKVHDIYEVILVHISNSSPFPLQHRHQHLSDSCSCLLLLPGMDMMWKTLIQLMAQGSAPHNAVVKPSLVLMSVCVMCAHAHTREIEFFAFLHTLQC